MLFWWLYDFIVDSKQSKYVKAWMGPVFGTVLSQKRPCWHSNWDGFCLRRDPVVPQFGRVLSQKGPSWRLGRFLFQILLSLLSAGIYQKMPFKKALNIDSIEINNSLLVMRKWLARDSRCACIRIHKTGAGHLHIESHLIGKGQWQWVVSCNFRVSLTPKEVSWMLQKQGYGFAIAKGLQLQLA